MYKLPCAFCDQMTLSDPVRREGELRTYAKCQNCSHQNIVNKNGEVRRPGAKLIHTTKIIFNCDPWNYKRLMNLKKKRNVSQVIRNALTEYLAKNPELYE